jgi:hypothetical protein
VFATGSTELYTKLRKSILDKKKHHDDRAATTGIMDQMGENLNLTNSLILSFATSLPSSSSKIKAIFYKYLCNSPL